jgi:hypothetical protein
VTAITPLQRAPAPEAPSGEPGTAVASAPAGGDAVGTADSGGGGAADDPGNAAAGRPRPAKGDLGPLLRKVATWLRAVLKALGSRPQGKGKGPAPGPPAADEMPPQEPPGQGAELPPDVPGGAAARLAESPQAPAPSLAAVAWAAGLCQAGVSAARQGRRPGEKEDDHV